MFSLSISYFCLLPVYFRCTSWVIFSDTLFISLRVLVFEFKLCLLSYQFHSRTVPLFVFCLSYIAFVYEVVYTPSHSHTLTLTHPHTYKPSHSQTLTHPYTPTLTHAQLSPSLRVVTLLQRVNLSECV